MLDYWILTDKLNLTRCFTSLSILTKKRKHYWEFLAVHNSSIGDLVTDSLTDSVTNFYFWHYRVTLETCDLWDIWSEGWGNMTWPTFLQCFDNFDNFWTFFDNFLTFFTIFNNVDDFWQFWPFSTILTIFDNLNNFRQS